MKVKIEGLSADIIKGQADHELHGLRMRCVQIWQKGQGETILKQYAMIREVMEARNLSFKKTAIDRNIDDAVRISKAKTAFEQIQQSQKPEYAFERTAKIINISKTEDERIVAGVVYAPAETDAHGDFATEEDIREAAYSFMEDLQLFKVNHVGGEVNAHVLETYLAPVDFELQAEKIPKGSWVLISRIVNDSVWQQIKSGELIGYSMAGTAVMV